MRFAGCNDPSAFGPLLTFGSVCFRLLERRGRRHPARAHAVAVGAARRLHCGARLGVASPNSLRSLRSLRSNSGDESVDEARCARRPRACAPRRHRNRPRRVPPAARQRRWCLSREPIPLQQRRARAGRSAPVRRREAQGLWPRAQRASSTDSSPLFERSERSERSEFGDGPRDRASQGSRRASDDRRAEARSPARACLGRVDDRTHSSRSWAATGRKRSVRGAVEHPT